MKLADFAKNYLTGLGSLIAIGVLLVLLFIFYFVYEVAYIAVIIVLAIVAILIVPYYLGKKSRTKPGNYSIKKVK